MDPLKVMADELEAIRSEIATLDAIDAPTEEQTTRYDELLGQWDEKKAAFDKAEARAAKLEEIRKAALDPRNVEPSEAPDLKRKAEGPTLEQVEMRSVSADTIRGAALELIEKSAVRSFTDDQREAASLRAESNPEIARYMLLTGSDEYRSAFAKALAHPTDFWVRLTPSEADAFRAAMSTTAGNGGYAIPFLFDPSLILANGGAANPFRQIARIVQGTSNKWQGLVSAGVTAEWKAEGAAAADASPTFTQPSITAYLADAFVLGSYEVLEDTNLEAELPGLFADAKDRLEATAFATGTGSQPTGVVAAVAAVTASRVSPTTGGTFTVNSRADVDAVIEAVPPRYRSRSKWVANFATYGKIRRMDTAGGGSFWANLGAGQPQELLGLPIYESSAMDSAATTGSNLLLAGDFQQYVIFDRIGSTVEYIPNLFDTASGRPTGQRGWIYHWRVGAGVTDVNAFRVLKL